MPKIEVEMLAFAGGKIREVDVPQEAWDKATSDEQRLELVFYWGQNDFQPKQIPSVSVGDVARLDGKRWECSMLGWKEVR